jgi:uncharacterized protein involved in outer membrane biogenesis
MRVLLGVLIGLAVALIAALLIGPRFVDWNRFKPELAALAERATGRPLAIDGDVAFSLLPSPTLSAIGVRLGNPPGSAGPELMRLKSFDARIAFLPLLAGRIAVESIALVEPALVLDAAAIGTAGWDAGLDDRLSVDRVIVVDGSVAVRAGAGVVRLERINAEIVANLPPGPLRVSGDVAWQGLSWRFELTSGRLGAAAPVNLTLGLRGGGANLRVTGTVTPGAGETLLAGRLRADTTRLPSLLAALGVAGAVPAPLGQAVTLEAGLEVGRARVALNDVAVTLGDDMRASGALGVSVTGEPRFDATLAVNRLDVDRWAASLPPAGAAAAPGGPPSVRGALDLTIDAVLWRGGVLRQARLNGVLGDGALTIRQAAAQLPGGSDVALFGHLALGPAPRFDGQLEGGADNLRGLFDWLKLDLGAVPPDRLRRVSVTAGLSLAADSLEIANMDLRFDASRLTGSVAATLGARPAFGANLRLDRLNLEAYLPRAGAAPRPASPAGPAGAPPAEPLDWLTAFDANLQLHVDQLAYDTLPASDVVVEATLERGTLSVHQLGAASVAGVRALLGGVVHRASWPAELELTLSAQSPDPSRLFQLIGYDSASAALGPLSLSMSASGPLDRLRLALESELAGAAIEVKAETNLLAPRDAGSATVTVRHAEALRLLRALLPSYRPAGDAVGPLALSATLGAQAGRLSVSDATLALGPASAGVTATLDLTPPRPSLTASVTGGVLVLDPLLPRRLAERRVGGLGADLWAVIAGAPATVAGLPALDADVTVAFGELDYQHQGAADVALGVGLRERGIVLRHVGAALWDGRVTLSGELPAREPLALKLALADVAVRPAAEALLGVGGLDGRLTLALDLGASAAEGDLAKSLAGSGRLRLADGALPDLDLAALGARLTPAGMASSAGDDVARAVEQDLSHGRTPLASLAGDLTLRGATVASDGLALAAAGAAGTLAGSLDLAARTLDAVATLQLGGDRAAPPVRVALSGPLGAPTRTLDAAALTAYLVAHQPRAPAPAAAAPAAAPQRAKAPAR